MYDSREVEVMSKELYPLDAPGMPLPGMDYIEMAELRGEEIELIGRGSSTRLAAYGPKLEEMIRDSLYGQGTFCLNLTLGAGKKTTLNVVGGHRWGVRGPSTGPESAKVMIIGKMLGWYEVNDQRCLVGESGKYLVKSFASIGVPKAEIADWYVTTIMPTAHPEDGGKTLKQSWVKNYLHLLHQQLRLVKPDYILCLGADAVKTLLGRTYTLSRMEGQVVEYEFPIHRNDADEEEIHTSLVMACTHPAAVLRSPENTDKFEQTLSKFYQVTQGGRWDGEESDLDHRVIKTEEELIQLARDIKRECKDRLVAMDAEWHGEHPQNPGAYLRTIQVSWAHKKAACIVLREEGGVPAFDTGEDRAIKLLGKILKNKRIAGHFFNADLEWLVYYGLDLRPNFQAPENWWECKYKGGLDTALMAHAISETDDFGLTSQTLRYTEAPRYDVALVKWKESYCKEHGLKAKDLDGYGYCPGEVLYPYANYDADVTRRLAIRHAKALSRDKYGQNCWEAFWVSQRAVLPVLEINTTGIPMDKDRVDALTSAYIQVKNDLELKIRTWANWPTLNLNSVYQVRELLFGERYNGKKDSETGGIVRIRPDDANSIKAEPFLTTGKRQRPWAEVVAGGTEDEESPATNKSVMTLMAMEAEQLKVWRNGGWFHEDLSDIVGWIRDYRIIARVLQSVLRVPEVDEETSEYITDSEGNWVYKGGLAGSICGDNRIRTTIYQTKETGRWSSARPPLQNISKSREAEYSRILGDKYKFPLRSVLKAPEGQVIIEADYVGAELFGMAMMSGDETMIDHARRNQLPDNDPDFLDIHSSVAKLAFNLDCAPSKKGLADVGASHLRFAAKSVVFGVAYGRGARAIALASKELGFEITQEEAQKIIDTLFETYPGLPDLFTECRDRITGRNAPRWLCGPFGRFRRFPKTDDRKLLGEFERQAMNFPIQGMIADAVSRAVDHLYAYRQEIRQQGVGPEELDYRLCLQIHDQINLLAPIEHVDRIMEEVIPECMVNRVPIYPCHLDGYPIEGRGPYYLGFDSDVCLHWGINITKDQCTELGINPKYGK